MYPKKIDMKNRSIFYLLLLFMACKDGGGLVEPGTDKPIVWLFNQSLASQQFSSQSSGTQYTFSTGGKTFTVSTPSGTSCNPIGNAVTINESTAKFESVLCGAISFMSANDIEYYYFVVVSRNLGSTVEYLTFAFPGQNPGNKTYDFEREYSVFGGYSIYAVDPQGQISEEPIAYYSPLSGSITTKTYFSEFEMNTSKIVFIETDSYQELDMKASLGCCSQ